MNLEKISSYQSMVALWETKLKKCKNKSQEDWIKMQIAELKSNIYNEYVY